MTFKETRELYQFHLGPVQRHCRSGPYSAYSANPSTKTGSRRKQYPYQGCADVTLIFSSQLNLQKLAIKSGFPTSPVFLNVSQDVSFSDFKACLIFCFYSRYEGSISDFCLLWDQFNKVLLLIKKQLM